jgi:hypothetical protein
MEIMTVVLIFTGPVHSIYFVFDWFSGFKAYMFFFFLKEDKFLLNWV